MFRNNLFSLKVSTVGQVTLKTALETATALTKGLYGPLFGQVDPSWLAEDERSKRIVEEYGKRLQSRSGNLRDGALEELVAKYPSHQFVIDRDEASERLFKNVVAPEPAVQQLVDALGELAVDPLGTARLLCCTSSGEAKEGGDRGHQDSEANEDGTGIREGAEEGVPETSAGGYAGNSPEPSKEKAPSKRTRVTRVN